MKGKVKKRKLKYINLLKTEQIKQMIRNFVNASVYVKHKINFTWSRHRTSNGLVPYMTS